MTDDISDQISDQAFADRAIGRLPLTTPSPGFEAALLAGYDAWNVARAGGRWAAWKAGLRSFSQTIWPGAPLWVPASVLAAALLVGAGIGAVLPAAMNPEPAGFSLEQPESFSLLAADSQQEDI